MVLAAAGYEVAPVLGARAMVDEEHLTRIEGPYRPFTRDADAHSERFERATLRIMAAIDDLLEEPYKQAAEGGADARPRADRLM
jgi:hypothetical protein